MRTDYAAQLDVCRDAQKQYCRRKGSINDSDTLWQEEIDQSAKLVFTHIETYLQSTSRPSSAASRSSKAESVHNFFDANLPRDEPLFNRTAPSSRTSSISISSTEFAKVLEEERQHHLQLEKRIQQMEITITNAEEVSRARQSERKLADENAKMKADLGLPLIGWTEA